jgi:hypothetical protein
MATVSACRLASLAAHRFGSLRSPSRLAPLALGSIGKCIGGVPRPFIGGAQQGPPINTQRCVVDWGPPRRRKQPHEMFIKLFSYKDPSTIIVFVWFCGSVSGTRPPSCYSALPPFCNSCILHDSHSASLPHRNSNTQLCLRTDTCLSLCRFTSMRIHSFLGVRK